MTRYQAALIVKEGAVLKFPTKITMSDWAEAKQMTLESLTMMPLYEAGILELINMFDTCPISTENDEWCDEHCGEGKPNMVCFRHWMEQRKENRIKYYESHKEE